MNYRTASFLIGMTMMVLAGCATKIETSIWQAESSRLQEGATYSWAPEGLKTGGDFNISREFLTPRIVSAVERVLNGKGYRKAEEHAALLLSPSVQIIEKPEEIVTQTGQPVSEVGTLQRQGAFDWQWVTPEQVNVEVYKEGTLLLTVTDTSSGDTLWQGSASLRVELRASQQEKERLVNEVVRALLKSFPDNAGKGK